MVGARQVVEKGNIRRANEKQKTKRNLKSSRPQEINPGVRPDDQEKADEEWNNEGRFVRDATLLLLINAQYEKILFVQK